jgi:preprotein translocase subunit SecD
VSSRRSHLILVSLICAALVGVAFLAVPSSPAHRPLKQGLDLQGGLEYVLKAQPPKGHKLTTEDLDRSVSIMRNRVDKLGVSEPIITKQGTDQISIQLAVGKWAGRDTQRLRAAVEGAHELERRRAEWLRPLQAGQGCRGKREEREDVDGLCPGGRPGGDAPP